MLVRRTCLRNLFPSILFARTSFHLLFMKRFLIVSCVGFYELLVTMTFPSSSITLGVVRISLFKVSTFSVLFCQEGPKHWTINHYVSIVRYTSVLTVIDVCFVCIDLTIEFNSLFIFMISFWISSLAFEESYKMTLSFVFRVDFHCQT